MLARPWRRSGRRSGDRRPTRGNRLARLKEVKAANEALAPWVAENLATLVDERRNLQTGLKRNAIARSREYAFPLHGEAALRLAMTRTARLAAGG